MKKYITLIQKYVHVDCIINSTMRNFKQHTNIKKSLLSKDKFIFELKREYALSCRTSKPFEFIVFSFHSDNGDNAVFIDALLARARTTDIIGWLEKNKIGIILYHADKSVSKKFIDSLQEMISKSDTEFPPYETYIYPHID